MKINRHHPRASWHEFRTSPRSATETAATSQLRHGDDRVTGRSVGETVQNARSGQRPTRRTRGRLTALTVPDSGHDKGRGPCRGGAARRDRGESGWTGNCPRCCGLGCARWRTNSNSTGQDGGGPVVVLTMSSAATTWSRGSLGSCSSRATARWTARWVRWRGFWPTVVRLM